MLRNFTAVMKDSFREAVDGFTIYVMLGLALLTVVAAASFSFEPDTGDSAFNSMVKRFNQVFQDRGASNEEVASRIPIPPFGTVLRVPTAVNFTATDVQKLDSGTGYSGTYKLRLKVKDDTPQGGGFQLPFFGGKKDGDQSILFPQVVQAWRQPKAAEQYVIIGDRPADAKDSTPEFEFVPEGSDPDAALAAKKAKGGRWALMSTPKLDPNAAKEVSDEVLADFVKNQFLIHADLEQVTVKRRTTADPKVYEFDVEATVPNGTKGWPHKTWYLFGAFGGGQSGPLGPAVYGVQDILVNTIGASITLLVAVILTGFFIPNMLRKGSLDLVMAKPMARWELLLYKYLGGLIFMLLISSTTVGGVWLVLAIRSGNWNPVFLLSIFFVTFTFAVLYAVSTLLAVLTRSAIVAILITSLFMVLVWAVGLGKSLADEIRAETFRQEDKTGVFYTVIDVANVCLPRYNDVLKLNSELLVEGYCTQPMVKSVRRSQSTSWFPAVGTSLAYIAGLLGLAYLRFATRDP